MGKYNEFGLLAERRYHEGKTLHQIASETGVSPTTLSAWKKKYQWAEYRLYGQDAELLYLENNPIETICEILPIKPENLNRWKILYHWETKRQKKNARPLEIAAKISQLIGRHVDQKWEQGWIGHKESDALAKMAAAQEKLGGIEDFPASTVLVFDRFGRFISAQDWSEEKKNNCADAMQEFFEHVTKMSYGIGD